MKYPSNQPETCLKLNDAFFDGILDDEAGSVDRLELPETVSAVDRLHFGCRVPPPTA